jgi:acetoin utilization deacetylase AcuC-like enzyme
MKIIFSPRCLEYSRPGYPENPERVRTAWEFLKNKYKFIEPKSATKQDLLKVHAKKYVEQFEKGDFIGDWETSNFHNIYEYAKLSAGAAIMAAKIKGFSLMRPPGHHAGINGKTPDASSLGFCYFNNMAIAVRSLNIPTLIIDIDVHHGNGTQEIFQGDEKVTFISLHRRGIYPGTGHESEDNCYNVSLSASTNDDDYVKALDEVLKKIDLSRIKVVGISAGFDTYEKDSLTPFKLSLNAYFLIGKRIKELKLPVFVVLEGGYGNHLGPAIHNLIQGLEK